MKINIQFEVAFQKVHILTKAKCLSHLVLSHCIYWLLKPYLTHCLAIFGWWISGMLYLISPFKCYHSYTITDSYEQIYFKQGWLPIIFIKCFCKLYYDSKLIFFFVVASIWTHLVVLNWLWSKLNDVCTTYTKQST